jgi:hypothetical protein
VVTARVTLRAPDRSTLIPLGVVANRTAIWVWGEAAAQRIDPRTNRVTTAIAAAGDNVRAFAATDTQAWALTLLGHMVRFDAHTGRRLSSVPTTALTRPQRPVVLPNALLIDRQDGTIAAIDLLTGHAAPLDQERCSATPASPTGDCGSSPPPPPSRTTTHQLDPDNGRAITRIALPVSDAETITATSNELLATTSDGEVAAIRP